MFADTAAAVVASALGGDGGDGSADDDEEASDQKGFAAGFGLARIAAEIDVVRRR